jgi:RNA polymerase sigma factor (sigma-70 family)
VIGLRLARREQSALAHAYAAFAPSMLSYVTRFVGPTDAEDVVQRTFLDAWRFAASYDPDRRFSGWLFTIARRRALDTLRSRRVVTVDVELARNVVGEDGRETAQRLAHAVEVRSALARLPEHERRVLTLTHFEQLTQEEVAGSCGGPLRSTPTTAEPKLKPMPVLIRPLWLRSRGVLPSNLAGQSGALGGTPAGCPS